MDSDYKLIHAVDPTKIKVNIKEKFAKLTLSSNKKKNETTDAKSLRDLEACKRISRNLMDDLEKADDWVQRKDCYVNPLLRSDSPSDCDSTQQNKTLDNECSRRSQLNIEESYEMEVLRVSSFTQTNENRESNEQFDVVAERISEQISSLSLNSKVITISSDSGTDVYNKSAEQEPVPLQQQQNLINAPEISICISSSTSEEEDSDDAITISDSSQSEYYDLITSDLPQSGETADALLPSTFSNDKADRMEAFLRDVSQVRREMMLSDRQPDEFNLRNEQKPMTKFRNLAAADTESMSADFLSDFDKEQEQQQQLQPSELDDTEPMSETHSSAFESNDAQANLYSSTSTKLNKERMCGRLLADDDTIPNTEPEPQLIKIPLADDDTIPNTECDVQTDNSVASVNNQDLASNETIPNSNDSQQRTDASPNGRSKYERNSAKFQHDDSLVSNQSHSSVLPEESITILETSSEDEEISGGKESSPRTTLLTTSSKSSILSNTPDVQSQDSSISQKQQNMGSINISAKINIKIHISEMVSSNDDNDDGDDDDDESENDQNDDDKIVESPPLPDAQQSTSGANEKDTLSPTSDQSATEIHSEKLAIASPITAPPPPIEQEEAGFMEHAQKLLNQLYGNAWQTPEVIRTLHKSRFEQEHRKPAVGGDAPSNTVKSPKEIPINQVAEESVLADFSIFRRNIKTNLDSTRRVEKPTPMREELKKPRNCNSEKRSKPGALGSQHRIKIPQTEVKKRCQRGGLSNERWRQLVDDDNDSDGVNASDDEAPDKTINGGSDDEINNESSSDKSWNKNSSSSSSDDDDDFTTRKQKRNITTRGRVGKKKIKSKDENKLVYMDLSKDEVEIVEGTPVANNEEQLKNSLRHILSSHKYEEKPKLEATPMSTKTRRKLFTANFGNESEDVAASEGTPIARVPESPVGKQTPLNDKENVRINFQQLPAMFTPFNKQLESVRTGTPIFKIQTPKTAVKSIVARTKEKDLPTTNSETPTNKYGFLKSLDVCVGKSLCHPDALLYRDNYRQKKEELGKLLYDLYNEKLFDNKLKVSLIWNKKLLNTAGRCLNKKKLGVRTSVVELSEKVLTSADRLRCTLIHELCHAATWIFNGEGGHGATWKSWANKANSVFPEIPKIGVCHQYDIEYKYTYKCTLCAAKSHAHSKSKKVENIRCSYCHGAIEVFLNKKDKDGNIVPTPVREPTGFAKFVKEKYKEYKNPSLKHTDVMKILSNEFALLKVTKAN